MLELNCWVLGEAQHHIFTVEIDGAKNISILKKLIKEEKSPDFDYAPADTLMLWKVSKPYDEIKDLTELPDGEALLPLKTLSAIFLNYEPGENVDIIIKFKAPPTGRPKHPHSPSSDISISKQRKEYHNSFPPGAPSSQAIPATFRNIQKKHDPLIYYNRPSGASSTPVTLLHPIFGEFVDDCQNYKPTEVDNSFVLQLAAKMSEIYDTEAERANAFHLLLIEHYHIQVYASDIPPTSYRTDGHISFGHYPYFITEAKNEIGSTGGDPFIQAALYYERFLQNSGETASFSVLPCFHIFYFGPFIGFGVPYLQIRST